MNNYSVSIEVGTFLLAFFNPFNSAISTNTTEDGRTILTFTYPKTIKKYTLGVSKESVSENSIDFSSILRGLITKITSKFKGMFSGSAGFLSGHGGTTTESSIDSEFDLDNNGDDNSINSSSEDNDSSSDDNSDSSNSNSGYSYPNANSYSTSSSSVFQSYLPPPQPTPSYLPPSSYELAHHR